MVPRIALVAALVALLAPAASAWADDEAAFDAVGEPAESRPPAAEADAEARDRDARIARLEREIERDQATLRRLVQLDPESGEAGLHDHPVLRDIAARLPARQAELERLRREAQSTAPPAP